MCTPALPRSRIGGANCDVSTITVSNLSIENDSGTRTKRTLKRCTKEDDIANGTRVPLKHMNFESSDESQDDFNLSTTLSGTSSSSFDTLRLLRTVRRHLGPLESPVPRKATSREADDGQTGSPTKSNSRKWGPRGRKPSGSIVELDPALQTTSSKKSPKKSKGFEPLNISSQSILTSLSPNNASREYALEDLNMKIRCYERHVTTWDVPDHAFFIFPAQLLITCTSKCDFDPLVVPDVSLVDLVCTSVTMGGPNNLHSPLAFSTFFDGAVIRYVNKEPRCHLTQGIHVEGVSSQSWSSTMNQDGHFGWYMRFWIPIPLVLFQRAETRSFKIDVKVYVNGAEDKGGHLTASSDFTLTRLMKDLAMK